MSRSIPNAEGVTSTLADDLRELADFLDQHPDLLHVRAIAWISEYDAAYRDPRARLESLARALGDKATETVDSGRGVQISGYFGKVRLYTEARVYELAGAPEPPPPPPPLYEPILPPKNGEELAS